MEQKLEHIAFIMDGNGRWAKKRLLPRSAGHREGLKAMESITEHAFASGIRYVSFFAFSTENWSRPKKEVEGLLKLLKDRLPEMAARSRKNCTNLMFTGDLTAFNPDLRQIIEDSQIRLENKRGTINVCLNYGGRREIISAANAAVAKNKKVDENDFRAFLFSPSLPDPDLLIRTGGERRLSNFMLYQLAYTELYFSDKLWPDFAPADLDVALADYHSRNRRFGGVDEENA